MTTQVLIAGKSVAPAQNGKIEVKYRGHNNFNYEFGHESVEVDVLKDQEGVAKWITKYFDKHLPNAIKDVLGGCYVYQVPKNDFSVKFYFEFQRRYKAKMNSFINEWLTSEPISEPISEPSVEPQLELTEEPTLEKKIVKIERPKAVGLEGQLQDIVFNVLESDFTRQTIENKMIQLGIEPNITEHVIVKPSGEKKNVGIQHENFDKLLKVVQARLNPMLVGQAGSGKTTGAINVAKALGLPFYSKSVSAQTGVHEFFGYQDANGNYVRTLFREAYEFGGVFLLDEIDAGNPNVLASINQALANGVCAFADGMVDKHEDFIVVACANTWGNGANADYVGRNPMDGATKDRFFQILWNYDENMEYQLASNKEWCKKVQAIRKKVEEKKIRKIVSPRLTFEGAKLLEVGMSEADVLQMKVYNGLSEEEIRLIS